MRTGQRILNLLKERGLTQTALAEHIGLKQGTISDWSETRKGTSPSADLIPQIADFLDISINDLFELNKKTNKKERLMNNKVVANNIRKRCREIGISQKFLFEQCDVNRNFMYDLENGSTPSVEVFELFAQHLNCSVDYLLGRTDNPEVNTAPVSPIKLKDDTYPSFHEEIRKANEDLGLAAAYGSSAFNPDAEETDEEDSEDEEQNDEE